MSVTAPFRMVRSPGVLRPAAKPGRMLRHSAIARACHASRLLSTGLGGRRCSVREHDPLSRRTSLVYGNGTTQSYAWSQAGDLRWHAHTLSGTANTWTLGYSKAHQLVSEAASNAAWGHVASVDETTSYGAANNLNQYVTVSQGASPSVTLTHDANGNLTGEGTWTFAYDAENRLRTASRAGTAATYLYDPLGRRQAKIVNGVTTSFLSDGDEEIAEYTGTGALLRRYIPGPGTDQPIAMVTPSGASHARSYFHVNRQGSTVAMSNDAGTVSEGPYTYDAYGQGPTSAGVPFKYTGRRLDPETGLYYYRARYYSASLGRFLQTDPVGYADQMNLYGYVGNDPVNATDPSGMVTFSFEFELESGWGSIATTWIPALATTAEGNPEPSGGSVAIGVAVSFPVPFLDGDAEWDAGVSASAGGSAGLDFPGLPGLSAGFSVGVSGGSVNDIAGESVSVQVEANLGKTLSTTVAKGVEKVLPKAAAETFGKTAGATLGLVGKAAVTGSTDKKGNTNIGLNVGIKKGFNVSASAAVLKTATCSIQHGCKSE